jgi:hypothetical protein
MSINISDPINFIVDDSVDISLNQTQINKYLTPIYDTSTNPKFTWENNKNTGMYHPQLNTIAFSTNGNERLKLDANGNINFTGVITGDGSGLNQLNASNIRSGTLTVSQGGTGKNTLASNQILIGNGSDPLIQSSYLSWDNSNNCLGVGTTIPTAKLDVSHDTTETVLKVNQLGTGNLVDLQVTNTTILKIDGNKNINMNNNLIYTDASNNKVGIGTTEPTEKFHVLGDTRIEGNLIVNGTTSIINTNIANSEQLNITNDGTGPALTINQKGNEAIIEIKDDDVTCLKVFDGGNLGIGTATKIVTADISGNLNVSQTINSANVNASSASITTILNANMIDISNNSINTALKVNQIGTGNLIDLQDNGVSKFKIDASGNITTSTLYIDASTNFVGIGTTQPNKKLHITGDTRIEGNLTVNGTTNIVNTNVSTTEQLLITNDGTGPAVIINQIGAQDIFEIQDDSAPCFKILNGGHVNMGTNTKIVNVDISGNIKSSGTITSLSTISSTGTISSSNFITAAGSGVHASYGNTRIGNVLNWGGIIHPTLGSSGTISLIMLDNPHITYKTDTIFIGRTFRAGIRCAANSSYSNYWDCGATGYGFEILNGTLNTSNTSSCMTISNSGNVGIGITNPINKLEIINSSTSLNAATGNINLYVYNPTNAANHNSIICNRIGGSSAGKAILSFDVSASHGWSIYTQGNSTALRINSNWEGASGYDRLVIANNGVITIGSVNGSTSETKLQVYSSDGSGYAAIFKHPNDTQGIGIKFDGIQALGTNANQDINLIARGSTGNVFLNTNASNRLVITGSGNVGIGAGFTNPYSLLHIKGTDPILTIMGQGGTGAKSQLNLSTYDTTSGNLSNCSLIATDTGNSGGTFQINLKTPGAITNTQFTPFYINSSGNIGISTNNPQNILQVGNGGRLRISNSSTDYTLIGANDTDTSNNSKIVISGNGRVGNEGNVEYYCTNTGSHIWYTTNTNINSERMRIKSNGNLGLGVTDPQYKLDMTGDININGDIRINGVPYINSVLVTPSYFSLFDLIAGPSTLSSNYTFTSTNTFSVFRSGILHVSYSGDVKSVNMGLINATINIINTVSSEVIYTKVSSLLADQATKNYSLPSILDNIGLTSGTYHATITFNTNTQINNNNYQTLKVLFFPDNNVSNGLYSYNTKISYIFHKLNGTYNLPPDGTQSYSMAMNNVLGSVAVSTGTTKINNFTIPKGYQIWTVGTTGTYTIIAGGASGASYGSYIGGRGAVISTTYNLTAGDKLILAVGQKPKNQSSGGGGTFVTKYNGTGAFTTSSQHSIILVAGGGGGAGSGIVPGASNVFDYLSGIDASFTTSGTRYNFKNNTYSSSTVAIYGGGGGGNGLAGGNLQIPDGTDASQTSSGTGGGGFIGTGGDVDSTCTGGSSFLNGGIPGQNTWAGINSTGAGFGGGGAGWYSGGGGGGFSGGQGANYNEQTGGGGGGSYDINTATNDASPYTLWLATSSYPPSSYVTSGYNIGDGFILIEYDNGQLLGSKLDTQTKPFYSWSEDIDTGMYRPAANNIALTTNGSEKIRVDPIGNIGIGKTNPMYKLDISGNNGQDNVKMNGNLILSTDGSSNYVKCGGIMSNQNGTLTNFSSVANTAGLCFVNSGSLALISNSAERMRIDNNGNVGIGITSISSRLHIAETTGTQAGANTGTIILDHDNGGGASSITFRSTVNRGSDYAYIQYQDSSSVGAGGESARLIIGIQNDPDDHILLMPSGNVGINNSDPSYKLDVNGTFRVTGGSKLTIQSGQDGGYGRGIMMWNDTDTSWGIYMGQSGGSRSLSGGTACAGLNFSQHAVRFRVGNSTTQGFIFENSSENCLFSIRGDGFSWLGGILNISDTQANTYGGRIDCMSTGSLIIGSISKNYGGGNNWTTNTAGFMMECADNTEIMIHDGGSRLASFMYYTGANNTFTIGRNAGWGVTQVSIAGDISITNSCSLNTSSSTSFYWNGTTSLLGRASAVGNFSSSAIVGDIILKSTNRLILQSGNGSYGVIIDTLNNVQMAGSITVSGSISTSGTITGNGSGLTTLNATNLLSGIVSVSRGGTGLGTLNANQILIGNGTNPMLQSINLTWDNSLNTLSATNFVGSGAGLTTLNVSNASAGTLNVSRGGIGTTTLTSGQILVGNGTGALQQSANFTWDNSNNVLSATKFVGSGTALTALNANNITIGMLSVIAGGTGLSTLSIGQLLIGNGTGALIQSGNLTWNNTTNTLGATNFVGSAAALTALNASNLSSGVVNISYGGTGKTTLNTNQLLIGNGINAMLQSTNLTWDNSLNILSATNFVGSGSNLTNLNASKINLGTLPVTYGGTGLGTLVAGKLLVGNDTGAVIQSNNLSWNNTTNTLTATNFAGSGASITNLTGANITGNLSVSQGGTGKTSLNANQILIGNATGALIQSANLTWDNPSNTLTASNYTGSGSNLSNLNASKINLGTLAVTNGGTGLGTLVAGNLLVGNGIGNVIQSTSLAWNNSTNTLSVTNFVGSGTAITNLTAANIIGNISVSQGGTGKTSLNANQILIGNTTGALIQSTSLSWDNINNILNATNFTGSGSNLTNLNASKINLGTLPVTNGGTGLGTLVAGNLLVGNGTDALIQSNNLTWTNNNILTATNFAGSGTAITNLTAANITGNISVSQGGTGKAILVAGKLLVGNGTGIVIQSDNLSWDNTNNILTATNFAGSGTSLTNLNATNIIGNINVSQGGTGKTTLVVGNLLVGNGTDALIQSNNLTWTNNNTLSATNFSGSGAALTNLTAANITGNISVSQGGTGVTSSTGTGSVVLSNGANMTNGMFSGIGGGLVALNATNISSGTLAVERGGTGVITSTGNGSVVLSNAATMTNCIFGGTGTGLSGLNASNISLGTVAVLRGGTGTTTATGTGSVVLSNGATMTNGIFGGTGTGLSALNATNISDGTLSVLRGGTGVTTSSGNGALVLNNAATMTNGTFSGTGTGLSGLNATNISSGTLLVARGGTGTTSATGSGSVVLSNFATMTNGTFSGTGTGLSALNATNINTGTLAVLQGGTGTTIATGNGSLVLSNQATMTNGIFSGTGTGLTALNASNINSGILNVSCGGTGLNTITNNKLLIGGASNSIIQSNNLHWNNTSNRLGINVTNPTSELDISGNVTILGNVIPATNITYDLGSTNNRWRDLYLSGNTINMNGLLLSNNNDGNLKITDSLGNAKKLSLSELEFMDGTEKVSLTKNVNGKMILVRKDLSNNVLETLNISSSDLSTVNNLGIGIAAAQLNATLDILSTNNNNGLLLNHTNASGNIINIQKNGTTKFKIDNSGNLFASTALFVDTSNNYVGICVTNPSFNLHVLGPARIEGNLIVNGTMTTVNTTIQNTDQLTITNNGTATTIIANQTGANSIVDFRSNGNTKFKIFSSGDVGIGQSSSNVNVDISGNLIVSGNMNASGSKLYNINATNINTGILSVAYGGTGVTSSTGYGSAVLNTNPIITNGIFSGTGTGLTALNGDNINIGKLSVLYGGTGVNTSTGSGSVVLNTNPIITNGTFSGTGSGLTTLNAENISTGTLRVLQGGTGCSSLNASYFDTTGNILSLKPSILNSWTNTGIGNNIYYNGNIAIGKTITDTTLATLDVSGNILSSGTVKGNGLITTTNLSFENVAGTAGAAWQIDIFNSILNFKNNIGGTFNNKLTLSNTGDFNVTGIISGNGSGLSSLNVSNVSSGILPVINGGTGLNNISINKLLVGNGTNQIMQPSNLHWDSANNRLGIGTINPTTTLHVLGSITGTNYIGSGAGLTTLNASNISGGTLAVSRGGTGLGTLNTNQLLIGNGTGTLIQSTNLSWTNNNTLNATNFVGSGTGLSSLNASNITDGILSVSRGGIGTGTLTLGKLLIGNGTGSLLQSTNLSWDNTNNMLGIGINNPTSKLHLYDDIINNTKLIIQNNYFTFIAATTITTSPVANVSNSITNSIDKYMIFTDSSYNFTIPSGGINCDILMIGGGGKGGTSIGGGGGAGACIVAINQTLAEGTCIVNVGAGDSGSGYGGDSIIKVNGTDMYIAKGGGRGVSDSIISLSGGCGGGAGRDNALGSSPTNANVVNGITTGPIITSTYAVLGNKGGDQKGPTTTEIASGGGGIGGPGGNHENGSPNPGAGGPGLNEIKISDISYNFKSYFANGGTFGHNNNGYIGGGGGGSAYNNITLYNGGLGGGGNADTEDATRNGAANTGSGAGGHSFGIGFANQYGGSGIMIIRYRKLPTTPLPSSSSIEFLRGITNDTKIDYKIGNYEGDFKIISSVSGTDTDRFTMNSSGLTVPLTVTATSFSGSGANLTSLNASNITGNINVSQGGTGATALTSGQLLIGNGTGTLLQSSNLNWNTTNNRLGIGTTNPGTTLDVSGNVTATLFSGSHSGSGASLTSLTATNITGNINVSQGGTGKTILVAGNLLVGNGTDALIQSNNLTWNNNNNTLSATNFIGSGTALTSLTATNILGNINVSQGGTGVTTLTFGKLLVGNNTGNVIQPSNLSWDNASNTLSAPNFTGSGATLTSLTAANITGNINVSQGGTGVTTLTLGKLLVGNNTGNVIQPSNLSWDDASNTLSATNFTGSGATITSLTAANITGNINVSQGGTGVTTLALGKLLVGNNTGNVIQPSNLSWDNASNTLSAPNFTGSGATLTSLSAANITGNINVMQGGTGNNTLTVGQLLVGNGISPMVQTPNLTWNTTSNRLGICTTTPIAALDVSGNVNILGTISGSGENLTNLNSSYINRGTLSISYGGTGVSSFTSNQILIGNGANNLIQTPNLTWNNNSLGIGKSIPSEVLDVSGNVTSSGSVKGSNGLITSKDLLFNNIAGVAGASWQMDISNSILNFKNDNGGVFNNKLSITNTGDLNVIGTIYGNGAGLTSLNATNISSGILSVSKGGTGLITINSNKLLVGNGTSQIIQPSDLHWDSANNRLGIGTNNPNSTLDVSGNISVTGTFIGSGNTLTNLNTSNVSSGTLIALYGGTGCTSINTTHFDTFGNILNIKDTISSKWTTSSTSIYYNTGNIGVGITNPIGKLDISQNSTTVAFKVNQIGSGDLIDLQDNSISKFKIDTSGNITASVLYVDASNNYIGIGTTQPSKQLHVTNESQFDNNMTINGDIYHNKRLTITNSAIGPALLINQIGLHPIVELQNNGTTVFKILDTGDVAIGTSTKSINVDISGNINASNVIRSNLFYVGNESSTYGILRVYNNNNDNCVLFINDTSRIIDGGSKTATLRNDGGALRLQSNSNKGLSIDVFGNVSCDTTITATGSGSHANWGNTRIGNIVNWNNLSYPTIGSNGSSGSVIVIENPYIPYKTNDIFTNRTFRAGIRCASDISYNAYWDCGATAYGFEILNSALNTGTSSCITINSNGNVGIGKTNPSATLDIIGNINLSGTITGNGSGLNNLNASNINSGTLAVVNGGTGLSSINTGCILIGNGTNNLIQTNNLVWTNNSLGIGKSNPTTTLDVSGNITASGIITGTGSGLSSLNATNISSGVLSAAYGGTGCTTLNTIFFDTTDGVLSVKNKAFSPWEIIGNNLNYDIGNIGIGKTNPTSKLDVSGNITASGNIIGNINATNIIYGTLSSANGGTGCSSINNTFFDTTGGVLSLKTGASSQWIGNGNKLYYNTGNVGIGNTNPLFDMDVSGNINFTGSLYKNGSQYISSQWTTNNSDLYFNSGSVAIGKTNPTAVLDISGNVLVNGSLSATGDIVANYSDDRLKNRISNISNSLEIINQLTAFKYTPNEKAIELGITNNEINIGLSAQDVQKVLPEIVSLSPLDIIEKDGKLISKTGENYLSIKYERLVPILIENIKELQNIINRQSKQIKSQDIRINELETKMSKILNYINV